MIYVDGVTAEEANTITQAANMFLTRLLPRAHKKISLFIYVVDKSFFEDETQIASCKWADDYHNPKEFTIKIAKMHPELLVKTLGHECVHVKQMYLGEMKEHRDGVQVCFRKKIYPGDLPYKEQPWEEEANLMEEVLFFEWKNR